MKSSEFHPLPDFLCIGAQKAATSWLWAMIRQHPGVWMPPIKELHFFDHLYAPENRAWTLSHIKKGSNDALRRHFNSNTQSLEQIKYLVDMAMVDPFTEQWYKFCFDRPGARGKIKGDITPDYSRLPVDGINHVKRFLGADLKLIYIIRDPVQRAISQLKMNITRKGMESQNEDSWLLSAKDPVIAQRGDYMSYIPRWEAVFSKASILYLPYGLVKVDPVGFMHQVETHLGIPHHPNYSGISNRVHKTREVTVPRAAIDYLMKTLTPQTQFLKKHFGVEFASLT